MTDTDLAGRARDADAYSRYLSEGDWEGAMGELSFGYAEENSPQLLFVLQYRDQIPDGLVGKLVWSAYKDAFTGIHELPYEHLRALVCDPRVRNAAGATDPLSLLDGWADPLPVYRGFHMEGGERRFSWTIDEVTAAKFALTWCSPLSEPRIARGLMPHSSVCALFSNEGEVVADPAAVTIENVYPVPERYWRLLGFEEQFKNRFGRPPEAA